MAHKILTRLKSISNINIVNAARIKLALSDPYLNYSHYYFCSFQKSGRTWLRFLLGNYFNIRYKLGLDLNFHNIYSVMPSLTDKKRIAESYQLLFPNKIPLILFTHSCYNPYLFRRDKILFMLRSVYDTIVSFYFHNAKHHQRYKKGIKSFIKEPNLGVQRWVNYMNSWAPRLLSSNCYVITYEQLYENTFVSIITVLEYLGIKPDVEIVSKIIELSSFERMQKIEIKKGIVDHSYDRSNNEARRIRKGGMGTHIHYLDNEDIEYIRKQLEINLRVDAKELVSKFYKDFNIF